MSIWSLKRKKHDTSASLTSCLCVFLSISFIWLLSSIYLSKFMWGWVIVGNIWGQTLHYRKYHCRSWGPHYQGINTLESCYTLVFLLFIPQLYFRCLPSKTILDSTKSSSFMVQVQKDQKWRGKKLRQPCWILTAMYVHKHKTPTQKFFKLLRHWRFKCYYYGEDTSCTWITKMI